tara:strand:+ start:539 stop:823 length:285 start_codon:yes stop_codon:yes gene_type:complete
MFYDQFKNCLIVSKNEYNSIHIEYNNKLIADSCTFFRKRGFTNKITGKWCDASNFTPKNIAKNKDLVLYFLLKTGGCGKLNESLDETTKIIVTF